MIGAFDKFVFGKGRGGDGEENEEAHGRRN
jgi:hypothetical protein